MSRLLYHLSYTAAARPQHPPPVRALREVSAALVEPQYGIEP
jgi:hypothetical protein